MSLYPYHENLQTIKNGWLNNYLYFFNKDIDKINSLFIPDGRPEILLNQITNPIIIKDKYRYIKQLTDNIFKNIINNNLKIKLPEDNKQEIELKKIVKLIQPIIENKLEITQEKSEIKLEKSKIKLDNKQEKSEVNPEIKLKKSEFKEITPEITPEIKLEKPEIKQIKSEITLKKIVKLSQDNLFIQKLTSNIFKNVLLNQNKPISCSDCTKEIQKNKTGLCNDCLNKQKYESKSQRKVERPSYEQLLEEVKTLNYVNTGKKYGVSDNTIRKWIKMYKKYEQI